MDANDSGLVIGSFFRHSSFGFRHSFGTNWMRTVEQKPHIPDHEVLRVIGRGAYGEIWMARGLTGALRAVKVVYRSTFENERTFNREFEGMSSFEPISRAHEGFVDILHVGRTEAFFYYIMELGDDQAAGQEIDLEHYVPKTLKTEIDRRQRLPVEECLQLALSLTDALRALHEHRLTHRDIKPANIIFVNGVPKLADIGLVAASGQRSFVGTEGYVPPEGPGTPQADLYSLGKVLYEISMGKDRLDFPEVTTSLNELPDKARLLQFNEVLLKACANDPAKRYESAQQMHDDLSVLKNGGRRKRRALWPVALGAFAVATGAFCYLHFHSEKRDARVTATVNTDPPGAMVLLGDMMKKSPATFAEIEPGRYSLRVMLAGFDPVETKVEIEKHGELPLFKLQHSTGSLQLTTQPPGAEFELRDGDQLVRKGVTPATLNDVPTGSYEVVARRGEWELKERAEIKRNETVVKQLAFATGGVTVNSEPAGADIFADGKPVGKTPLHLDLATGTHAFAAKFDGWPEDRQTTTVERDREAAVNFDFGNGSVKITSAPGGATVVRDGTELGQTPLLIEEVKPGNVAYELRLTGYKAATVGGTVTPKRQAFLAARLERKLSPDPNQPWTNSLGMRFVPVGGVRFCVWETRVKDYDAFCAATGRQHDTPDFEQTPEHPVVKVSWNDAEAFCKWLTEKERSGGMLEDGQFYRLPTDIEWSNAVGLQNEGGNTPEERDGKVKGEFPWGKAWPPPGGAGNYSDVAAKRQREKIDGYSDGSPQTAPVGSFKPDRNGIFDMGGNVWEWIEEDYKNSGKFKDWGVLRGGSWGNSRRGELESSYRNVVDRNDRDVIYGFRCVLVSETAN